VSNDKAHDFQTRRRFCSRLHIVARFREISPSWEPAHLPRTGTRLRGLRAKAQARMPQDRAAFGADEFKQIEAMYQPANQNLRGKGTSAIFGLVWRIRGLGRAPAMLALQTYKRRRVPRTRLNRDGFD
jgi:hypothetical protein